MFLVTCERAKHRWISAVFRTRADAVSYVGDVPVELRAIQRIVEFPPTDYPAYLVEDAEGFNLHTSESLAEFIGGVCRVPDNDWCYFNVYRLAGDWRAPRPGTDHMGAIPHVHIENRHLDRVHTGGVDALW